MRGWCHGGLWEQGVGSSKPRVRKDIRYLRVRGEMAGCGLRFWEPRSHRTGERTGVTEWGVGRRLGAKEVQFQTPYHSLSGRVAVTSC